MAISVTELEEEPLEKEEKPDKRLSLILSHAIYDDVASMANERRTTMTEVVRLALGLVKVAIREAKLGNKLVVANDKGEAIKELILPG